MADKRFANGVLTTRLHPSVDAEFRALCDEEGLTITGAVRVSVMMWLLTRKARREAEIKSMSDLAPVEASLINDEKRQSRAVVLSAPDPTAALDLARTILGGS